MHKLYTDGGSRGNPGPAGLGAILFDENDTLVWFDSFYIKEATNNQAEYSALILGLKMAKKKNVDKLVCILDSELVVKQLTGEYKIKNEIIKKFKAKVDTLAENFSNISYEHVKREKNKFADNLVNLALNNVLKQK